MRLNSDWSIELFRALDNKNPGCLEKIPKVDLHCHSITSVPIEFYRKINPKVVLPPKTFKEFKQFNQYLKNNINPLVKNIDICRLLLREAFNKFVEQGIIYTEMSFDLSLPEDIGVPIEEYFEMVKEEKKRVSKKMKVCIEAGIDGGINQQKTLTLFKKVLERNILGSIDLYGDEKDAKIERYVELYKLANKKGLKLKAHVGETGSALSIKEAVIKLNLNAVQHGVRAVEDKDVVEYLVSRRVVLNICPTSNLSLGLYKNIKEHPIKKLFDCGAIVTVGSDDFTIFGTSVGEELVQLYKNQIFTKKEVQKIISNGLDQIRSTI